MAEREPTAEELAAILESGGLQTEQPSLLSGEGIKLAVSRWLAKNLSSNQTEAMKFLQRRGYNVKPVQAGDKMQFLLSKPGVDRPFVLDPGGFDVQDITDLASDIVGGAVTAAFAAAGGVAGSAGGPVGAAGGLIAGGAVGSGGFEAIRQAAGGLAGVNLQPDVGQITEQEAAGAAAGPAGKVISKVGGGIIRGGLHAGKFVTKKGANIARNMLARIAGVTEEELAAATRSPQVAKQIISESAPRAIDILDRTRGLIDELSNARANPFPEMVQADKLLETARPVSLKPLFRVLLKQRPIVGQEARAAESEVVQLANDISTLVGSGNVLKASSARIPATKAREIVRLIQDNVTFGGRPGESLKNNLLKEAQRSLRLNIQASMPSSKSRSEYGRLMGIVEQKMDTLGRLKEKVGEFRKTGSENYIRLLFGKGKTEEQRLIGQFDKLFEQQLADDIKTSAVAEKFARDVPKLTATGQFMGPGLGAGMGAGIGAAAGGPTGAAAGALVGAAAGFEALSPKGIVRLGRGVNVSENAIRRGISSAGREVVALEPSVGGAARTLTASGLREQPRRAELPPSTFEADIQGDDQSATTARQLAAEINALPNLTPSQRLEMFEQRLGQISARP